MSEISEQDLRTFLGPRADFYLGKWRGALAGEPTGTGFNWAAFWVAGLWLPYRKMYRATTLYFTVVLAETFLEDWLTRSLAERGVEIHGLDWMVTVLLGAACGVLGNGWYLAHARQKIEEIQAQGLSLGETRQALAAKGGTSVLDALGTFLLVLMITVASWYLIETILGRG